MRLLIRALGSPVPEEVEADSNGTLLDLYQLIQQDTSKISPEVERHRLVYRGRVLRDSSARLRDLCTDGGVVVVLLGRQAAPRLSPPAQPPRPISIRDINVAIRADLSHQSQGTQATAEAAAQREQQRQMQQQGQAQGPAAGVPLPQLLEQALLSGEMSALRGYLEQLQAALQVPGQQQQQQLQQQGIAGVGLGGGPVPQAAVEAATAALFGLPLGAAARAAGGVAALGPEEHGEGESQGSGDGDGEGSDFSDEHGGYLPHPDELHFPAAAEGLEGEEEGEEEEEEEEYTDEDEEGYETDDALEDGGEEGEHELRGAEGELQPPQVPDLDSRALAELMEMGFPEALCRNALLWGRNQFEPALEWVLGHAEDPAATDPLSDAQLARLYGRGQRRAGVAADQAHLAHLVDMGFDQHQAAQALRAVNNSLPAACQILLTLGAAAAPAPAPVPPAPAAASAAVTMAPAGIDNSGAVASAVAAAAGAERAPAEGRASEAGGPGSGSDSAGRSTVPGEDQQLAEDAPPAPVAEDSDGEGGGSGSSDGAVAAGNGTEQAQEPGAGVMALLTSDDSDSEWEEEQH